MVDHDIKPLGDLIKEFYDQYKGPDYLDEIKAVNSWVQVAGTFVASHTVDISIKNKVMYVRVDSDALRTELGYSKSLLVKKLNDIVGKEVLRMLVLD